MCEGGRSEGAVGEGASLPDAQVHTLGQLQVGGSGAWAGGCGQVSIPAQAGRWAACGDGKAFVAGRGEVSIGGAMLGLPQIGGRQVWWPCAPRQPNRAACRCWPSSRGRVPLLCSTMLRPTVHPARFCARLCSCESACPLPHRAMLRTATPPRCTRPPPCCAHPPFCALNVPSWTSQR